LFLPPAQQRADARLLQALMEQRPEQVSQPQGRQARDARQRALASQLSRRRPSQLFLKWRRLRRQLRLALIV
jgi:hypothetical protein